MALRWLLKRREDTKGVYTVNTGVIRISTTEIYLTPPADIPCHFGSFVHNPAILSTTLKES